MVKAKKKAKNKKNCKCLTEKPFGYVFGRPTKYLPEYCDLKPYLEYCKKKKELPSQCGYAVFLSVAENTVIGWGKDNPDFLRSLSDLKTIEKQCLMNNGLTGDWNSTITKLILSANHGLVERLDTTSGGEKICSEPLTIEQMKERFTAAESQGLSGLDSRSICGGVP
jgi:hypothetical protein